MIINILLFVSSFFWAFLAGRYNAIMDTVESHFDKSVFNDPEKYPKPFYGSKSDTSGNKYKNGARLVWFKVFGFKILKPVALTDHWHQAKSRMLVNLTWFVLFIIMDVSMIVKLNIFNKTELTFILIAIALLFRACFGFGFWLFYNYLLLKK